jgi:hypothetical protein
VPPGWPEDVRPPGGGDFEASAIAWLLDVVPPYYRQYSVLRRHHLTYMIDIALTTGFLLAAGDAR